MGASDPTSTRGAAGRRQRRARPTAENRARSSASRPQAERAARRSPGLRRWLTASGVRASGLGGLAAIGLDVGAPAVVGALRAGYDPYARYMSELGAPGGLGAGALSLTWVVSGLLFIGLAVGFHQGAPTNRGGWASAVAIAGYGALTGVGSGLFPCDPGCQGATWSGRVHDRVNAAGAWAQLVAPGLVAWRLWPAPAWRRLAVWSVIFQVISAGTLILFLGVAEPSHGAPGSPAGLLQRIHQGGFYLWLFPIALRLAVRGARAG